MISKNNEVLLKSNFWNPTLALIGQDGFPSPQQSSEVLRKVSKLRMSMRLPPTLDPEEAEKHVMNNFDNKIVDGFTIKVSNIQKGMGFNANKVN